MKENERPEAPKMPPSWADPQALHNWEDEMARYSDSLRWDATDYAYPTLDTGYDVLFPMDEDDIDALTGYAG